MSKTYEIEKSRKENEKRKEIVQDDDAQLRERDVEDEVGSGSPNKMMKLSSGSKRAGLYKKVTQGVKELGSIKRLLRE